MFSWYDYEPLVEDGYVFKPWGNALGFLMTFTVVGALVLTPVILMCLEEGSFMDVSTCISKTGSVLLINNNQNMIRPEIVLPIIIAINNSGGIIYHYVDIVTFSSLQGDYQLSTAINQYSLKFCSS